MFKFFGIKVYVILITPRQIWLCIMNDLPKRNKRIKNVISHFNGTQSVLHFKCTV